MTHTRPTIILFLIVVLFVSNCTSQKNSVKGYRVESAFPEFEMINNGWMVREYKPVFKEIYYYGNHVMLKESYYHSVIESRNDSIIYQSPETLKYKSLIFTKHQHQGILIDSNNLSTALVVAKDSILYNTSVFQDVINDAFTKSHYELISSSTLPNGTLIESYSSGSQADSISVDVNLRFSGTPFKKQYYQLSPGLEADKKMRLIEYVIIINAPNAGIDRSVLRYELPHRVEDIPIKNKREIIELFNFAQKKLNENKTR